MVGFCKAPMPTFKSKAFKQITTIHTLRLRLELPEFAKKMAEVSRFPPSKTLSKATVALLLINLIMARFPLELPGTDSNFIQRVVSMIATVTLIMRSS